MFQVLIVERIRFDKFAVAGGDIEIVKFCEKHYSSFEGSCTSAILFHRNNILPYIYENEIEQFSLIYVIRFT